jgi:hypothetical protein
MSQAFGHHHDPVTQLSTAEIGQGASNFIML